MKRSLAYKYCPQCGHLLTKKGPYYLECDNNHPYYVSPKPTVCVIIEKNQKVLIVKRGKEPHKGKWEFPGGFISPGDKIVSSAIRETKEELGVIIKVNGFVDSYVDIYPFKGVDYEVILFYLTAEIIDGELTPSEEVTEFKFVEKRILPDIDFGFEADKRAADGLFLH